jgi:antitoxin ParD1/3/4
MAITLSPEVEERVERRRQQGGWNSASDVVRAALDLMDDIDTVSFGSPGELESKLKEGLDSAERGELYTPEEVRAHLAELRRQIAQ